MFFRDDGLGRPRMEAEDRAYLSRIYAEPNQKLSSWLGKDLSHWT